MLPPAYVVTPVAGDRSCGRTGALPVAHPDEKTAPRLVPRAWNPPMSFED